MTHELFYTSAPKGLRPGSRGFCTVASTEGLPAHLAEQIESLSAYRPLFPPLDAKVGLNPIVYSHLRVTAGPKTYHVLSRVGPAGLDYSQRSNKFAHHVILEPGELPAGGPAWLLAQPGFVEDQWDGEVRYLPAGRIPPQGDASPSVCRHWRNLTGDAGWGGVLADSFEKNPPRQVYLIFSPGTDLLPLVVESLRLIPPAKRWLVTFSTYFTNLPQGIPCLWRFVAKGSPEAANASRLPGTLVINLTEPLGKASESDLVEQARTGRIPAKSTTPSQEIGVASHWPNDFERNQGYSLLETSERSAANAKAPPPPSALRRPVTQIAKPKRTWIWAALIGLIFGLLSGILASFLILKSQQHLTAQDMAILEEQRDEAVSAKEKAIGVLEARRKAENDKARAELKKREEELADLAYVHEIILDDLHARKLNKAEEKNKKPKPAPAEKQRAEPKRDDLSGKTMPRKAGRPFPLPEWRSKTSGKESNKSEMPIKAGELDQNGKCTLALLGTSKLKVKFDEKDVSLTIEDDLARFAIRGGQLSFEWTSAQPPDPVKKSLLRDSILEIKSGEKICRVPLREPVRVDPKELKFSVPRGVTHDFVKIDSLARPSTAIHFESLEFLLDGKKYKNAQTYPCIEFIPVRPANEPLTTEVKAGVLVNKSQEKDKLISFRFESSDARGPVDINVLSIIAYIEIQGTYVEIIRVENH